MQHRSLIFCLAMMAALVSSPAWSVTPAKTWLDSYSVGDQCYCVTTYDHGAGDIEVDTPEGLKTVRQICERIGPGPGVGNNPIYNDVQCGNGPANDAIDETLCPGRVDLGKDGCPIIGPTWNLDRFFTAPDTTQPGGTTTSGNLVPGNTDSTTSNTTAGSTSGSTTTSTAGTTAGTADSTTNTTDGGTTGGSTGATTSSTTGTTTGGSTTADTTTQIEQAPQGILFEAEAGVTADSRWYVSTTDTAQQDSNSDPDANHSAGASNATYLELLPDTLVIDGDAITEDNQWTEPGYGPILQYEIDVPEAGVYAIAVRGYATGAYDRKIHAGVDGLWTTDGANITLCETNVWSWSNCNNANNTVEFATAGIHQLMFSAADDGFELDQFVLTAVPGEANTTADTTDSSETNTPEAAKAVAVGDGVAFGAALAHGLLLFMGLILMLRRRSAKH